ncbi:MAG: flagellar biosynthesis protein FlhA, partial [Phycisphaerales bacterium]|nr:flagellar biosynthesis protein FlhA [Phycisphaerales bacterium]
AVVIAGIGYGMIRSQRTTVEVQAAAATAAATNKAEAPSPESLLKLDAMELEVGYGLVSLVDTHQGGDLLERISAIRRQTAADMGVIMPPVRIRDNLQLPAHEYRLKIKGAIVARGQTIPGQLLAIDSGISSGPLDGTPAKEPAFGLDAWWIDPSQKTRAETMNYTVVDPTSVLATHMTEVVKTFSAELLSRQEVTELVAQLKTKAPKLVEEVLPTVVKTADLHRVLQNLLRERIPIRDMETIVETLADWMPKTKDTDVLTEYVRNGLRRSICQLHAHTGENGKPRIVCITLDPSLEDFINGYIDRTAAGTSLTMPAATATSVADQIVRGLQQVTAAGHHPVVLASPTVRAVVRQIIEPVMPSAAVLGYNEIVQGVEVESLALITHLPIKPSAAASHRTPQESAA